MPECPPTWQALQQKLAKAEISATALPEVRPILYVDTAQQRLWRLPGPTGHASVFPVSTSRHGVGQQQGSLKTPLGIHRIAQKIGDGEPCGRIFKARRASEEICRIDAVDCAEDVISSRILWLDGMQPGYNQGGEVDSFQRYIYIHGTADEAHIGQPASIGCIRMKNDDVIALFDTVAVGDRVIIE